MPSVKKFIKKLKPYIGGNINKDDVDKIINDLENNKQYIFTINNFSNYFPDWQNNKKISFIVKFLYSSNNYGDARYNGMDIIITIYKKTDVSYDFSETPEYEKLTNETKFYKHMNYLITPSKFKKSYILNCFDPLLQETLKDNNVIIEINN